MTPYVCTCAPLDMSEENSVYTAKKIVAVGGVATGFGLLLVFAMCCKCGAMQYRACKYRYNTAQFSDGDNQRQGDGDDDTGKPLMAGDHQAASGNKCKSDGSAVDERPAGERERRLKTSSFHFFFTIFLFAVAHVPLAMGLYILGVGLNYDTSSFWVGCGPSTAESLPMVNADMKKAGITMKELIPFGF